MEGLPKVECEGRRNEEKETGKGESKKGDSPFRSLQNDECPEWHFLKADLLELRQAGEAPSLPRFSFFGFRKQHSRMSPFLSSAWFGGYSLSRFWRRRLRY